MPSRSSLKTAAPLVNEEEILTPQKLDIEVALETMVAMEPMKESVTSLELYMLPHASTVLGGGEDDALAGVGVAVCESGLEGVMDGVGVMLGVMEMLGVSDAVKAGVTTVARSTNCGSEYEFAEVLALNATNIFVEEDVNAKGSDK